MKGKKGNKLRFNISIAFVYIIGIILLVRLFDLQIVNGETYREESNTRLTRETTLKAARGDVLDASGNKLVSTTIGYNVEIYKTKVDTKALNNGILLFAKTLEENGDRYVDTIPILVNPIRFVENLDVENWKKKNNIDAELSVEEIFKYYCDKYEIECENEEDTRKVMTIRYTIDQNGYSNTKSVQIANNISNASFAKLNEMSASFPGMSTVSEPEVSYPYGELGSHILGYVGKIGPDELEKHSDYDQNDSIGKTGIEKVFEKYLRGQDGIKQIAMSVDGAITDEYITEEAIAGSNVVLTIDADLQRATEQALQKNIEDMQNGNGTFKDARTADQGAAVVINVKTGEILAMASFPNYNPSLFIGGISTENWNNYLNDSRKPLINKAIAEQSAPGSTFKMVTAIAGLESGAIDLKTKINDTYRYTYYKDYQPTCWKVGGHGWLNITQAIEHSCNYFFYETGRRAGISEIVKVAKSFGLGEQTGIELPDEISGHMSSPEADSGWTDGNTIQTAIGQLYNNFTPLQMAKYTAMIANGGRNIEVSIIKSIDNADGTQVSRNEIETYVNSILKTNGNSGEDLNISNQNLTAVKEGMKGVTSDDGGTAYSYFKDFNIEVGGKTGSASTVNGNANAWFVGFAPYDSPEIAVAVYVKNGQHGGYTAPVAREIFAQYLGMNASSITEDMTALSEEQKQN